MRDLCCTKNCAHSERASEQSVTGLILLRVRNSSLIRTRYFVTRCYGLRYSLALIKHVHQTKDLTPYLPGCKSPRGFSTDSPRVCGDCAQMADSARCSSETREPTRRSLQFRRGGPSPAVLGPNVSRWRPHTRSECRGRRPLPPNPAHESMSTHRSRRRRRQSGKALCVAAAAAQPRVARTWLASATACTMGSTAALRRGTASSSSPTLASLSASSVSTRGATLTCTTTALS